MEKYIVTKHFRCTPSESAVIDERAKKEKKKVSAYLRDAALSRSVPVFDERVYELLERLRFNELKIGYNINQAVKMCNTKKHVTSWDYEKLTSHLLELCRLREAFISQLQKMQSG